MKHIKILMTRSYGAGWSSWESNPEIADFMLTYQPLIDYIEAKDNEDVDHDLSPEHPLVLKMLEEIKSKFNLPDHRLPCVLAAENLIVEEVYQKSLAELLGIRDYDGSEYFKD
ncbi:hypothetical protein C4588_06910 [Candidatus Parcubacteria bacterium]|nr:MAG: hypothetical protein C4588_06910 [Candidatus Parcubacteria bacterium]